MLTPITGAERFYQPADYTASNCDMIIGGTLGIFLDGLFAAPMDTDNDGVADK
jgi:hypothetical protein